MTRGRGWFVQYLYGTDKWADWSLEPMALMEAYAVVKRNDGFMRIEWRG